MNVLKHFVSVHGAVPKKEKRSYSNHSDQKSLKSTVTEAGNISGAAVVCRAFAAVSGTICSSHLTSFLSHSPVHSLSRRYSITRLQDALTLSPFSSHVAGEGVRKGRAQQAVLCSAQTRQQCERRCSFTQKSPNAHIRQLAAKH